MSLPTRWRIVPAALALTFLVASCGASPGEDAAASTPAQDSPINELFKGVAGMGEDSAADAARIQAETTRKVEEQVAACMAKQGFDYTPNVQTADAPAAVAEASGLSAKEYAAQYGYGVSTYDDTETTPTEGESGAAGQDPNAAAYEQMSESERAAYDSALWGETATLGDEADDAGADPDADFATASATGCYAQASAEVEQADPATSGVNAVFANPQFAELLTQLTAIYTTLDQDPAVMDANQKWADCMAKAGYTGYRTPDEAVEGIFAAFQGLWSGDDGEGPSTEALDEMKKQEIDTATADNTCQQEVDYDGALTKARFAAEKTFIDEHRSDLDALVAALQEAGK